MDFVRLNDEISGLTELKSILSKIQSVDARMKMNSVNSRQQHRTDNYVTLAIACAY